VGVAAHLPISSGKAGRTVLHTRVRIAFSMLAACYVLLASRLAFLQVYEHGRFVSQANEIREHTFHFVAQRGDIVDRNGLPLAISVPVADIYADPTLLKDPQQTANLIASTGVWQGTDQTSLLQLILTECTKRVFWKATHQEVPVRNFKLISSMSYSQETALKYLMDKEAAAHRADPLDRADNLAGLSVVWRFVRNYPNNSLAAQVLGFPSEDSLGQFEAKYGVEASQNAVLAGTNGFEKIDVDDARRPIPGTEIQSAPVKNGNTLRLTIDLRIQAIAEQALAQSINTHHAKSGTVVVLDPTSGDILAMASLPSFDPNNAAATDNGNWDDRAVTDEYEPGSTLKTLTLAAVLDKEGLQMANEHVYCTGRLKVGKYIIHCAQDPPDYGVHKDEAMQDVLRNSCNIGAAIYAMQLGAVNLYHYEKAFGLFDRPQCGLPGALGARLVDPSVKRWSQIQLADVAFGQGVSLTALQLASVYATIANKGVRVYPHIVLGQQPTEQPYQVIKPEVAAKMLMMLRAVVTSGTGTPAQVANYTVGGKTGSAQVAEHGHYGDQYIGSFCGIAPITNPKLVVLCVINKPTGVHWGAVVAAPVVRTILQHALWYLNVPPDAPGQAAYVDPHAPKDEQTADAGTSSGVAQP
jgi:cell division protein FtsI (penicillin-binding protein 3)